MAKRDHVPETLLGRNHFPTDPAFTMVVRSVEAGIRGGIHPGMIHQGSSGSYFAKNETGDSVGVFKPRNEEPFAHQNPKWQKYLQRVCFPCCFGRSCLLSNQGYLSEAGASLVDERLGLNIVPRTRVVELSSMAFSYTRVERKRPILPTKVGSFQLFMNSYEGAGPILRQLSPGASQRLEMSERTFTKLNTLFQKMVVLDYVIRNTDRSDDNWMVKYTPASEETEEDIWIAAIDNGLAFPFKHPDLWRFYPFYFATSSLFGTTPFVEEVKELVLPKLENPRFVQSLVEDLRELFKMDPSFDKRMFGRQMGVLRGQIWNLKTAMSSGGTPASLAGMPCRIAVPKKRIIRQREAEAMGTGAKAWDEAFRIQEVGRGACFSCC